MSPPPEGFPGSWWRNAESWTIPPWVDGAPLSVPSWIAYCFNPHIIVNVLYFLSLVHNTWKLKKNTSVSLSDLSSTKFENGGEEYTQGQCSMIKPQGIFFSVGDAASMVPPYKVSRVGTFLLLPCLLPCLLSFCIRFANCILKHISDHMAYLFYRLSPRFWTPS